jgi:NAD(P)-dependent dehydrogenase (short-subunit alcohol dehydrogenase family)
MPESPSPPHLPSNPTPPSAADDGFDPIDVVGPFRLDASVVVVTGASSGLGMRFARVLHAAGAAVVVGARRVDRLEELAAAHERMRVVPADVTVEGDRQRLVDEAIRWASAQGRRFDVLVNNAGIGDTVPALDETLEGFQQVVDVNLTALFRLSQLAASRFMTERGGTIVQVASMLGLVASAPINQASYVASKSAVVGLTRELGCQWARKGVRVNALAPGWFPSEMTDAAMFGDPKAMAFLERNCPIGRAGESDELDGALLLLATAAGSYLVGQTLTVDGGWTAR